MNYKFYLASSSPRRRMLLTDLGLDFEVCSLEVDENINAAPIDLVLKLSYMKCKAVADIKQNSFVLAADTIVYFDGNIIGKPKDENDARRILNELNGNTHEVYTGFCLYSPITRNFESDYDCSQIEFVNYTQNDLDSYIQTGEPFDKAGAYAIQGYGANLVKSAHGSYSNIVGLPLEKVYKLLYNHGFVGLNKNCF